MDAEDLKNYLHEKQIAAEILFLAQPTPTVEAAAEAVGVTPEQIVKSVLFMVRDGDPTARPVLVIGHGKAPIDQRRLAQYLQVGRKRVRLATPAQVETHTGYAAGTVPPFGHPQPIPTLMDAGITRLKEVFAGGGAMNALMRLAVAELQRVTAADIVPLT